MSGWQLRAALLLTAVSWAPSSVAAEPEVRALWVVRTALVSPESVDAVVDDAARAGFNTLLVQVRGRGDAFYRSSLVPRGAQLSSQPADFDPLSRLLARARARNLSVHAWMNTLLAAGFGQPLAASHVVARHPEWVMVPRQAAFAAQAARGPALLSLVERHRREGVVEGFYLSPATPGVIEHLEAVVSELLGSYPLDGLHLDFIRFPAPEYDYSAGALAAFSRGTPSVAAADRDPAGFTRFRQLSVTRLAGRLSAMARRTRPGVIVSAAVLPEDAAAREERFQEWPAWLATGILDAVAPMAYAPETWVFRQQVQTARAAAGPQATLWAGVGAYRLSTAETAARIQAARGLGASGVAVFSHESLVGKDLDWLRGQAFSAQPAEAAAQGAR